MRNFLLKNAFFLFMILSGYNVIAQVSKVIDIPYEVSEGHKVVDAKNKLYFSRDNKLLAFKWTGREAIIQTFDASTMDEKSRKTYSDFPAKSQLESVLEHGDQLAFFFSSKENSEGNDLYMRVFDFSGEFIGDNKLLVKADAKVYAPFFGGWADNNYQFSVSNSEKFFIVQDHAKKFLAITYQYGSEKEVLNVILLDKDLSIHAELRTIDLPYNYKSADQLDYALDEEGGLYILAREYFGKKKHFKTENGDPNFEMSIYNLPVNDRDFVKYTVALDNLLITNAALIPDENGNLICAGFYSDGLQRKNGTFWGVWMKLKSVANLDAVGVFSMPIKKNLGEGSDISYTKFPIEVINLYSKAHEARRNERRDEVGKLGIPYLKLRNIAATPDGGSVIVCEQFHIEQVVSVVGGMSIGGRRDVNYDYYFEDVFVAKFDKEGELVFMKKIPKNQKSRLATLIPNYKGELSIKYHQTDDFHYVFFLDNIKNLGLDEQKAPARHANGQGGFFTGYRIDNHSGDMEQFSLFDMRDIFKGNGPKIGGYQFSVKRMVATDEKTLLLELYVKKKKDRIIKVILE